MKRTSTLLSGLCIALAGMAQISDGSFEAGIGAGTWTEASVTFGTPLCDEGSCGTCSGPCVPRTGDIYAWFGGSGSADEIGSVEQSAAIPTGTDVSLVMWVKIGGVGDGTADNYIKAFVDGTEIGQVTAEDSTEFADYAEVILPLTGFADGAAHTIKIEGKENGTAAFNGLVDDIGIAVDGEVIIGLFENEAFAGMRVFPNPANDQLTLMFNALKGRAVVTVTDLLGSVVATQTLGETFQRSFVMDTRSLANGAYVVSVAQGEKRYDQRVVIAH